MIEKNYFGDYLVFYFFAFTFFRTIKTLARTKMKYTTFPNSQLFKAFMKDKVLNVDYTYSKISASNKNFSLVKHQVKDSDNGQMVDHLILGFLKCNDCDDSTAGIYGLQ